ncbi:oligodendrocyte-myelin glycoprotein-like [Sphaeramia orbicularis]|uniref:oligodendrocyte-myelin glycoprotein-like n=1 Tax=Sphaeramia orbicularis TaxID=375764 RepID=UPI001180B1EA|nr:oligodendrocyte-myelin glycoprotein-like [Sphaeramia orbicularis]
MKRYVKLLKLSPNEALLELLLLLLLGLRVLAVCPSICTCSRSHREVDCSWRGLRLLPDGLQYNLHSLNLSHNRFQNMDDRLTLYTHLRVLDVSHNRLTHLPTGLPRSLWQLYAASNRIQCLDKNDTVYQWNLQILDLSKNKLERAVFINNTLINLHTLNLSHNHFWTLPTNMPIHLDTIDISHNLLVKVLPGSLDRLPRLTHFYLHANRFSSLPFGALDKMTSLKVITLGNNPWACHLHDDVAYIVSWSQHTFARVLGCPCHTQSICGGVHHGRTGGWHFASYNLPPLAASAQDLNSITPEAGVTNWWYLSVSSKNGIPHSTGESLSTEHHPFTATPIGISTLQPRPTSTHHTIKHLFVTTVADHMFYTYFSLEKTSLDMTETSPISDITETPIRPDVTLATDQFFTTESPSVHTKKTTTLRTRSVRRHNQSLPGGISNTSPVALSFSLSFLQTLALLSLILQ